MISPVTPHDRDTLPAGLQRLYRELESLQTEPEADDFVRPTEYALRRIMDLLDQTAMAVASSDFPDGCVTTDDFGGIRIEWWRDRAECVHLVVGAMPDADEYVFIKFGDEAGNLQRRVDPRQLAEHLRKLSRLRTQHAQ